MKYVLAIIVIGGVIAGYLLMSREKETPHVVLQPYALLCSGEFEYFSPGESQCFTITKEGYKMGSTSVTIGLKYFGDISTTTDFSLVSKAVDEINLEVEVTAVSLNEDDGYVIYTKIGKILMKGNDLETETSNVKAFLRNSKLDHYEYIDARHGGSIFYK